jgi:predicted amidohydrolase
MIKPAYLAAAVQFEPVLGDTGPNVERLLELTAEAARRGAELVVLPEMATSGYCWTDRSEIAPFVETIPGPTVDRFAAMAAARGIWVVLGMPEVDPRTGLYYNAAALVGPDGLAGRYRKTHPYITEVRWAADGDLGLPVFDSPLGRLGILICMDAEYPEPARVLALDGCDVVCFPTNWLSEHSPSAYWLQRSYENGAYWVAANRIGMERGVRFSGGSSVIGPDATILDLVDDMEGVAIAEVDLGRARRCRSERLEERRPELYHDLCLNSYLWPNVHAEPYDAAALDGVGPQPGPAAVSLAALSPSASSSLLERVDRVVAEGAPDLLVLPPLAAVSSAGNVEEAAAEAARMLGWLQALATRHAVTIAASAPILEDGAAFDAVVVLRPTAPPVIHRNTHPRVAAWAKPGDAPPPVCRTPFGLLGLVAAEELVSPEPLRVVAVRGAEFVAATGVIDRPAPIGVSPTEVPLPAPCPRSADPLHWMLPRVRAAENNVWLALSAEGTFPSGIYGPSFYRFPRREALAIDGVATLALPSDPLDRDRRSALKKPLLRMRLPYLYSSLTVPQEGTTRRDHEP